MKTSVTITIKPEQEQDSALVRKLIFRELSKTGLDYRNLKLNFVQEKRSVDARHGQLKLHIKYTVFDGEEKQPEDGNSLPEWKKADGHKTVLIAGSGPAGLFGALTLLEKGIKPVIIERGQEASERKRSIAAISTKQTVDENSNYCFGEGGAGTFSDGKLYTRSNKRGNIGRILNIFVHFGADPRILTDAHPHIGTDALPEIITNIRKRIIELGGEFLFDTKVTNIIVENERVSGLECTNLKTGAKAELKGDAVVLATGHSATDIYNMLAGISPSSLEAKTFAVGVRVEHPRSIIDGIQFHGKAGTKAAGSLGAAEYRLTTQVDGRGVYSFCMCPGGFVVPSQTGPDEIVVNGMSNKKHNSLWSNAAIVVETRPEDIPEEFVKEAETAGCPALAGLFFRRHLEMLAKQNGSGQKAPAQMMKDFIAKRESSVFPKTSYTPGITPSRLDRWLPPQISERLKKGFLDFDRNMKGFVCPEALMIAAETRTSTPVRILRDSETFECPGLKGLYPAGEGSGYAGGIVSSAMDGENVCRALW